MRRWSEIEMWKATIWCYHLMIFVLHFRNSCLYCVCVCVFFLFLFFKEGAACSFHWVLLTLGQLGILNLSSLGLCSLSHRLNIVAAAASNAYCVNPYYLEFCEYTNLSTFSDKRQFWLLIVFFCVHLYSTNLMKSSIRPACYWFAH